MARIREALDADTAAILLHDEERHELAARAAVGLEEEVERGIRIPVGRGFAGRIAAERRPIVLDHVDHTNVMNPILHEKGIKSMLGVPLIADDDVLGVLHVGTSEHRAFTEDDAELLELVADRLALERILMNLVVNALHHGKPPVVLSVVQRDRYLRVRVEDSGDGVPPDLIPRLFERFERGGAGQGSGLGLAIAQTYARAHGGDLLYDPSAQGGARFELILPRGLGSRSGR